jgi:hypothetical protein
LQPLSRAFVSDSLSAGEKVRDQRDDRQNDNDVDGEAGHVKGKEQDKPENRQNNRDCYKHLSPHRQLGRMISRHLSIHESVVWASALLRFAAQLFLGNEITARCRSGIYLPQRVASSHLEART